MTDPNRKPISKRLRYEILRRDNHTCRYCGGTAPDVTLTVDHVIPVSLGGDNKPENLVAACRDCNAGKASSNPDAPLVDTVADDALRWAAAMRRASDEINGSDGEFQKVLNAVQRRWKKLARGTYCDEMPSDWSGQVANFHKAGLSRDDLLAMVDAAYRKQFIRDRWPYFYGCCRKRLSDIQERASQIVAADEDAEVGAHRDSDIMDELDRLELVDG